jgi:uncharacterized protein (TIGR02145 family)
MRQFWFLFLAGMFLFGCGDDNGNGDNPDGGKAGSSDSFEYQGQTYKTVAIGTQTWMAENLNYDVPESKCYDNNPNNCAKYGRLYTWHTAMEVCPAGWHLPSEEEWDKLVTYVKAEGDCFLGIEYCLKAKNGWYDEDDVGGNGTDEFKFAALPGGRYESEDGFSNEREDGYFWGSSTQDFVWSPDRPNWGYYVVIHYNGNGNGYIDKSSMYSVRCIKD